MFEAPRQVQSAVLVDAQAPAASPTQIELLNIGATLWRGRATIVGVTIAALLLAVVFVLIAPHRYTAITEILIDPVDLHAVANDASPAAPTSETALLLIDSQVRVLMSDDVLRPVVASQGLTRDPEFVGKPSLLHVFMDAALAVLDGHRPLGVSDPALTALNALKKAMRVTRAERTYVVDVAVSSKDPAKAARLANAVAQSYLAEQTQVRADAARQVSQSLTARLNDLKERVHRAEERVEAFKASHNIVNANGQLVNEQQLSDLNNQLAAARARTAAAKARLEQVEAAQKSKDDIGAFPEAVQSPTITALRAQYAEIVRLQAQQTTSLGPRHPAVIEIQAQAERLKRMIDDEVNRIARAARAEYDSAKASQDLLERNVETLKQGTLATDAALVSLRELQRDVQANRAVYEAFLLRARQTGEQERIDTKNIQIISKADLPLNRTSPPSNALLAFAAVLLGLAAGSGLVLLRDAFPDALPRLPHGGFRGFKRKPEDTASPPPDELSAGVPVLAKLPGVDSTGDTGEPNLRFAAGIRKVYEAVQANHKKRGNPSIMVVASHSDDDTAAVALTLAALAAATQRVLLIDADLDQRTLSAIDADRSEAGLVDVATGRRLLSDVVVRDHDTNISMIPFISPHSRRERAIKGDDIKTAFAQAKHFDVVIVAAMDLVRDPSARLFAGLVDHIVVVAKAEDAERGAIAEVVSGLGLDARKLRGAVVTEAEAA